jgi:hypothetical protein
MIIDFGWSCCIKKNIECSPQLELLQIIRSCTLGMDRYNAEYLYDYFRELYKLEFNISLPKDCFSKQSLGKIDKLFSNLHNTYEEGIWEEDI